MLYKYGRVASKAKRYIIFESNYTGYVINVPNVDDFDIETTKKIFIYDHSNEYNKSLYGFKEFKERLLFEDLISIQGIGPKTALSILSFGWEAVLDYIINGDIEKLSSVQYVGIKSAKQMIFELQDKYTNMTKYKKQDISKEKNELKNTLKTLGFKEEQILKVMPNIKEEKNVENMIEEAIKLISQEYTIDAIKA